MFNLDRFNGLDYDGSSLTLWGEYEADLKIKLTIEPCYEKEVKEEIKEIVGKGLDWRPTGDRISTNRELSLFKAKLVMELIKEFKAK